MLYSGKLALCTVEEVQKPSQRTNKLDKKSYDALSMPGYVIKKNLAHGAEHGASERQRMYTKGKEMLQKGRQPKRCGKDGTRMTNTASICQMLGGLRCRLFSMTNLHWKTTPFFATREERTRNGCSSLSEEGVEGPLNQRSDFR